MRFKTKRELLKHLGKHEKDNKWVDRALARGTVVQRKGWYCSTSEYLEELEKVILALSEGEGEEEKEEVKEVKEEKSESSDWVDWDTYVKALNRLEAKDNYIYWLQMQIKKLVDPKWEQDEWDIISALNTDWWYDPHDENYL